MYYLYEIAEIEQLLLVDVLIAIHDILDRLRADIVDLDLGFQRGRSSVLFYDLYFWVQVTRVRHHCVRVRLMLRSRDNRRFIVTV